MLKYLECIKLVVLLSYFLYLVCSYSIETAAEWYLAAKSLEHQGATEKFYSFHSKLLEKTSKKDVEALYRVGCFYLEGKGGVELNEKKGFKFLLKEMTELSLGCWRFRS